MPDNSQIFTTVIHSCTASVFIEIHIHKCSPFSIPQCLRAASKNFFKSVRDVIKYRFSVDSSPFMILFEHTIPIAASPFHSS